jgi:hypothetical protein
MTTQHTLISEIQNGAELPQERTTQLPNLVSKKVPIRFCEFKISNCQRKMTRTDTLGISPAGLQFSAPQAYEPGVLLRVWVEMPDFWARKARHVSYQHTDAPTFFQILSRVLTCEEVSRRGSKFQILCENVNLDPHDEKVLRDYLGLGDTP